LLLSRSRRESFADVDHQNAGKTGEMKVVLWHECPDHCDLIPFRTGRIASLNRLDSLRIVECDVTSPALEWNDVCRSFSLAGETQNRCLDQPILHAAITSPPKQSIWTRPSISTSSFNLANVICSAQTITSRLPFGRCGNVMT
jgi:hypothetical protein